jgi:ribonuclease HI
MELINYCIYADGGSRGNPGPSGSGVVIFKRSTYDPCGSKQSTYDPCGSKQSTYDPCGSNSESVVVKEISKYLGVQTNNYAEYTSLVLALQACIELEIQNCVINLFMDSKLVVEQVNERWKVKSENIKLLNAQVMELLKNFTNLSIKHIRREKNKIADLLANKAMDLKS